MQQRQHKPRAAAASAAMLMSRNYIEYTAQWKAEMLMQRQRLSNAGLEMVENTFCVDRMCSLRQRLSHAGLESREMDSLASSDRARTQTKSTVIEVFF